MRVGLTPFIAVLLLLSAPVLVVGCHKKPRKGANSPNGGGSASSSTQSSSGAVVATADTPTPATTTSGPPPGMSESDRKAIARAAYQEGLGLQEGGKCTEALSKFEVA